MFPYFENWTYLKAGHHQLVLQIKKKSGNHYIKIILHRRMNNFFMYNNELHINNYDYDVDVLWKYYTSFNS